MRAFLVPLVRGVLRLTWPKAPRHAVPMIVSLVQLTVTGVKAVEKVGKHYDAKGIEKFDVAQRLIMREARSLAIPGWQELPMRVRNAIIGGLIELVLVIWDISDNGELDYVTERTLNLDFAELRRPRSVRGAATPQEE